jgi:diphosphomevalonate decarboxylase
MIKEVQYAAPSNIALVKYWGKYGQQMPCNPSISFTLDQCKTLMKCRLEEKKTNVPFSVSVTFEHKENELFATKIIKFFEKIATQYPILSQYHWAIESENTFPHSSGIASSASSMAALAMCIESLQYETVDIQRASNIARIGSGSASRSVIPQLAWWGKDASMPLSSNEYAIACHEAVDELFLSFQNTILIAHSGVKSVSSSQGHQLMNEHTYRETRYRQAFANAHELYGAMRQGDLEKFGDIVEEEALTLHALMMMSHPSFILMKPSSLAMIDAIRSYRSEKHIPMYFTLDAGPNIHLLYPKSIVDRVHPFIQEVLAPMCEDRRMIFDQVGHGPATLS